MLVEFAMPVSFRPCVMFREGAGIRQYYSFENRIKNIQKFTSGYDYLGDRGVWY